MFYSQFILAKKGPLGTIWIAAHLERKLKKNQVADTDIGVSVDSILFPEVPIALRLSSHLLLGVVRIYSRKVNYLFHDCSEALLKVKQAFRSTAVDLPPEESTAPYHSITLPETFDLDDFELPDSALLSGNFDDRHVSTREQITLQDTLDGTGYSTSQFGLDERFGDGDASQIGLDLDEELLLDNNLTLQDASVLDGSVHQGEGHTKMDIDEGQHGHDEDQKDDASKELSDLLSNNRGKHVVSNTENVNRHDDSSHRLIFNIQTPDLNELFLPDDHIGGPSAPHDIEMDFAAADHPSPEFNESVNFPSTPGLLLEEAIQANSHELPASSLHKNSPSTVVEAVELDKPINQEIECPDAINAASTSPKIANLAQVVSSPTSVLAEPKPDSVVAGPDTANNCVVAGPDTANNCVVAGPDTANNCNLAHVEPADPNLADNSQMLPSSTSAPHCPGETMTTPVTCDEANAQPVSLDKSLISVMASGIDGITLVDTARLSNLDQGRVEDAHSCQTSSVTALSSDFHLRSCITAGNQANLISPENMVQERAEGFSFREQPFNLETPMVDQEFNFSGFSADLQGFRSAIATYSNLVGDQKSNHVQAGHGNCFSSSEFSEPERMRFAPSGNVNLLNDLGHQTTEKGVIESDGSVDRISTLSGHKRHLIDSTPDLQNGISPKMSGIPQKKRNDDYIPNDDDLLASILVGRRTPALWVGPTPPLPKPPLIKRPRLTNKPKRRKVLLDDKIVLHADAIRQQLINTEDIRRIRKKVPCTRSEIWRIQKCSLEDDIFCESIFTGISEEMNSLLTRRYDLAQNVHSQINGQHSTGEAAKGLEFSKSSILVGENDGMEMAEQSVVVPKRNDDEMQGPSGILELIETENTDVLERLESSHDPHNVDLPGNIIARGDLDADICANPEQNSLNNSHELAEVNNNIVHVAANNETALQGEDFSNVKDVSITVEDMGVDIVNVANLDCPRDGSANIGKNENGGSAVSMLDGSIVGAGADFPTDSSTVIGYANSSVPDMGLVDGGPVSSEYQAMKDFDEGRVTAQYETVVGMERPDSEFPCGERPRCTESEQVPSAVGENSCMNTESGLDVESTPMELAATKEPSDFYSDIDDIDTDFLNVDDEVEYDDETNDDVPNTEEVQSLENSGWSSRTRGVARYLKNMFDQESGRGRKSVAIDQLLAGKTRKEACRMFFETLVLKTKDYIHVEQENPFDFVNVKPRIKLLKSEF